MVLVELKGGVEAKGKVDRSNWAGMEEWEYMRVFDVRGGDLSPAVSNVRTERRGRAGGVWQLSGSWFAGWVGLGGVCR